MSKHWSITRRWLAQRVETLFEAKQGKTSPWSKSMFRVVDQKVRGGIIQGLTTQQIADEVVHETISRGVNGVSLQGQTIKEDPCAGHGDEPHGDAGREPSGQ